MVNRSLVNSIIILKLLLLLPFFSYADGSEEPKLSSEFYAKLSVSVVKILAPADGKLYAGSGVVVGKEEVLTNCHVVRRSDRITVMKGALRYPVDSQKVDIFKDLCLLSAPGLILPAVELRDPAELQVGNYAYFYGYPGGADAFFTEGRVSGLHPYEDSLVIKTTAGFSSGGSGGGLFDSEGRLIGITTFFSAGHTGSYYALPSDWLHNLRKRSVEEVSQISGLTLWEKDLGEQPIFLQFSQYMEDGNLKAALLLTSTWTEIEPLNFDSWLSHGKVLHALGRNEEARTAVEKALGFNPRDANVLLTMTKILKRTGDSLNLKKVRETLELVDPQGVAEGKCNMAC